MRFNFFSKRSKNENIVNPCPIDDTVLPVTLQQYRNKEKNSLYHVLCGIYMAKVQKSIQSLWIIDNKKVFLPLINKNDKCRPLIIVD